MKLTNVRVELTHRRGLINRLISGGWSWTTTAQLADGQHFVKFGHGYTRRRAARKAFAAIWMAVNTPVAVCPEVPCPDFEDVRLDATASSTPPPEEPTA